MFKKIGNFLLGKSLKTEELHDVILKYHPRNK
jgi:hypothetical protein